MRDHNPELEKYRLTKPVSSGVFGAFMVPNGGIRNVLRIISSGDLDHITGWEHVSVSKAYEAPTWDEMCRVKNLFWRDDETVVQFHPRKSEYKNVHPFCLHLWKHSNGHPLPPSICV